VPGVHVSMGSKSLKGEWKLTTDHIRKLAEWRGVTLDLTTDRLAESAQATGNRRPTEPGHPHVADDVTVFFGKRVVGPRGFRVVLRSLDNPNLPSRRDASLGDPVLRFGIESAYLGRSVLPAL